MSELANNRNARTRTGHSIPFPDEVLAHGSGRQGDRQCGIERVQVHHRE